MKYKVILILSTFIWTMWLFAGCPSGSDSDTSMEEREAEFSLSDYYTENKALDAAVDTTLKGLTPLQQAGQMIITAAGRLGKTDPAIVKMLEYNSIGGILLLNGSMDSFTGHVAHFDSVNEKYAGIPLLYSADAEPSLMSRKIQGSSPVPPTIEIRSAEHAGEVARIISGDLHKIGILHNFAPVVDLSPSNEAITNRSFGFHPDTVIARAVSFIKATQEQGIISTAKHFPGHGLVRGDTHSQLVYIDGTLLEAELYKPLIDAGVLSIMVGHIAVRNNDRYNTEGLPASCSFAIVSGLLRDVLQFNGLVVTDAMNMGALSALDNAPMLAVEAGCDMILMPRDEIRLRDAIVERMYADPVFKTRIQRSVKRILRAKWCLGIMAVGHLKE